MNQFHLGGDTIYLDHAATTPIDPTVLRAMLPYFSEKYGNPSSMYRLGQEGRAALDQARLAAARVLHCDSDEVIFTSGATESDNLALRGVAWAARLRGGASAPPHIVTTAIEHHAVLHSAAALAQQGFTATYVAPDSHGIVDPSAVAAAIRPETCLVSVMYANNETGSMQHLRDIQALARERGIPVHTDAVQAAGMLSLDVDDLGVDLLSLSAHKFYGPKGVGLLYVRTGTAIEFQQAGGGQEQGRRGGTENVPGIVGLGIALAPALRLPNTLNVSIGDVDGETVLLSLDMLGVAASAGSACTTGNTEPSHVLRAMGLGEETCRGALRFTVGQGNTPQHIDATISALTEAVSRARAFAGSLAG